MTNRLRPNWLYAERSFSVLRYDRSRLSCCTSSWCVLTILLLITSVVAGRAEITPVDAERASSLVMEFLALDHGAVDGGYTIMPPELVSVVHDTSSPAQSAGIARTLAWKVGVKDVVIDLKGVVPPSNSQYPRQLAVFIDSRTGQLIKVVSDTLDAGHPLIPNMNNLFARLGASYQNVELASGRPSLGLLEALALQEERNAASLLEVTGQAGVPHDAHALLSNMIEAYPILLRSTSQLGLDTTQGSKTQVWLLVLKNIKFGIEPVRGCDSMLAYAPSIEYRILDPFSGEVHMRTIHEYPDPQAVRAKYDVSRVKVDSSDTSR